MLQLINATKINAMALSRWTSTQKHSSFVFKQLMVTQKITKTEIFLQNAQKTVHSLTINCKWRTLSDLLVSPVVK